MLKLQADTPSPCVPCMLLVAWDGRPAALGGWLGSAARSGQPALLRLSRLVRLFSTPTGFFVFMTQVGVGVGHGILIVCRSVPVCASLAPILSPVHCLPLQISSSDW